MGEAVLGFRPWGGAGNARTPMGSPSFTLTLILALADPQPASPTSLGPPQPPIASRLCTPSPEQDSGTTPRLEQVRGWGRGLNALLGSPPDRFPLRLHPLLTVPDPAGGAGHAAEPPAEDEDEAPHPTAPHPRWGRR